MKKKEPNENLLDSPLVEIMAENAEVIADRLIDNEFLKEIPVFGSGLKLAKAAMNIRDRIFIAKLSAFIDQFDNANENIKNKWRIEATKDQAKSNRIGESLFLVVEQANDLQKPSLCAIFFVAYIDGYISEELLSRFIQIIDKSFLADMLYFLRSDELRDEIGNGEDWMSTDAYGLVSLEYVGLTVANAGMEVRITDLGVSIRDAYRFGKSKMCKIKDSL